VKVASDALLQWM